MFRRIMPVLRVRDMTNAIDWYTRLLGFELRWRAANDGGGENCMLEAGGVVLMLTTGSHVGEEPAFTGTLYFEMDDVSGLFDRIKDKTEIVWPLEAMDYGTLEFGIRDCDGYMLAFAAQSTSGD